MSEVDRWLDLERHPLGDPGYATRCADELDRRGVVVVRRLLRPELIATVLGEVAGREGDAFYASSTHNVWLDQGDPAVGADHVLNRQVVSSKGLLADDQISSTSPLRTIYDSEQFRSFVADTVGVVAVYPYADSLSSINVHFHRDGEELGWHFDNSRFAVTALLQAPDRGGEFEYVAEVRNSADGHENHATVEAVLDGRTPASTLPMAAGDLVIFRGRDSMHRVTPTLGSTTRILVVFAFNEQAGISLSDSAAETFFGRTP